MNELNPPEPCPNCYNFLYEGICDACEYHKQIRKLTADNNKLVEALERITGMAGNPDAVAGCRLICKRARKVLAELKE